MPDFLFWIFVLPKFFYQIRSVELRTRTHTHSYTQAICPPIDFIPQILPNRSRRRWLRSQITLWLILVWAMIFTLFFCITPTPWFYSIFSCLWLINWIWPKFFWFLIWIKVQVPIFFRWLIDWLRNDHFINCFFGSSNLKIWNHNQVKGARNVFFYLDILIKKNFLKFILINDHENFWSNEWSRSRETVFDDHEWIFD